jgi:hypothetical protein
MKKLFRQTLSLLTVAAAMSISSCDDITHDDMSECPEGMVIQLVPKYAAISSFESEMTDVHIFIYDGKDALVKDLDVDGPSLAANHYQVSVEIPEGDYRLVVWNGLSDTNNYSESNAAVTLKTEADNSTSRTFQPLWHGAVNDVSVESLQLTTVKVPMVKDTNNFVVFLCTTTGDVLNPDDFDFKITSSNGAMAQDNTLLDSPKITYNDFLCTNEQIEGSVDADYAPSDTLGYLHVVRAELNTLRLTTDHPSYLAISDRATGKNILTLNLNDYILKGFHSEATSKNISDQVYFDTEDLFNLTFFLSPNKDQRQEEDEPLYFCAVMKINSWILRLNDFELW